MEGRSFFFCRAAGGGEGIVIVKRSHVTATRPIPDLQPICILYFQPFSTLSPFSRSTALRNGRRGRRKSPPPCFQETRSVMPIFSGNTQRGSSSSSEGIYLSIIRKQRLSRFVTVPKSFQCKGFIKFTKVCSRRSREKKFFFLSLLLDGWKQKRESTNN